MRVAPTFCTTTPPSSWEERSTAARLALSAWATLGERWPAGLAEFDMRILYHSRHRKPEAESELGVEFAGLRELLEQAHFVTLNVPMTPETRHLIGEEQLAWMRPDSVLINVARGGVVDHEALYRVLADKKIAGAAIDVTEPEPLPRDHPLLRLSNLVITPHLGFSRIPDPPPHGADDRGQHSSRSAGQAPSQRSQAFLSMVTTRFTWRAALLCGWLGLLGAGGLVDPADSCLASQGDAADSPPPRIVGPYLSREDVGPFTRVVFKNGLTVLLFERSNTPLVAMVTYVKAGRLHQGASARGFWDFWSPLLLHSPLKRWRGNRCRGRQENRSGGGHRGG